jgi:hypothetical protein
MELISKFKAVLHQPSMWIGTAFSVLSVLLMCFKNEIAAWIALGALIIGLFVIIGAIVRVLNSYLEKDVNGNHRCIASIVTYKSEDGNHVTFEMCRFIQVKCAIMQMFDPGFKWTGTNPPEWKSDLQDVVTVNRVDGAANYDKLILRFRKPPLYNQTAVIHYKTTIDDADHKSLPFVDIKVDYPTDYVRIVVELGYKNHKNAIAQRKLIHSEGPTDFVKLTEIPYDIAHKQYIYNIPNPEPGYFYRLAWER